MLKLLSVVMVMAASAPLGACAGPSVWEQSYVPAFGAMAAKLPEHAPVSIRSVPYERVDETMRELDREAAASDLPRAEWSGEQRRAADARLLRGLQVTDADAEVLGVARFKTTDNLRPETQDSEALKRFARSIGAGQVVWSSANLGKADKIVDRPVTTFGHGYWGRHWDDDWGWGPGWGQTSTTWVPVRIEADENLFVFFFLR